MTTRRFNKAAVRAIFYDLQKAIHAEDRDGQKSDGSQVFDAAYQAWQSLADVLGLEAKHLEGEAEDDE